MKNVLLAALLVAAIAAISACSSDDSAPCPTTTGTICTYMGTGKAGLGKDGVAPESVQLYLPQDLAFGPNDAPFVLDWNNHRVRTIESGVVKTVVGTGELGDASDGPALQTRLNHPTHVSFAPSGHMILSAWHNSKVGQVDLGAGTIKTICGNGKRHYAGDRGPAAKAVLDLPVATVFDSKGRMYISDQANQRIRRVNEKGTIDTVLGPPKEWLPDDLTWVCDKKGSDVDDCKVCKKEDAAKPDCTIGKDAPPPRPQGFAGDGGPGDKARIYLPVSQSAAPGGRIDIGADDTVYLADTFNHRIRALSPAGIVSTVAGSGPATFDPKYLGGYGGDGGPATKAKLKRPTDVAVAPDGTLFIADTFNSCVRRVLKDGTITTAAGQCGKKGDAGDGGPATDAKLDRPYGVYVHSNGDLYIADTHNHRIRVVHGAAPAP